MTDATRQVEMTGETVGEAKWAALRELESLHPGLDKAAVRFQVVSEGARGLLGVGYAPARVIASVDEDAVAELAPAADERSVRRVARERGIDVVAFRGGDATLLVIGYANVPEAAAERAATELRAAWDAVAGGTR